MEGRGLGTQDTTGPGRPESTVPSKPVGDTRRKLAVLMARAALKALESGNTGVTPTTPIAEPRREP